ncbi:MAG: succinyl-diaminopimelate desuccinylase [Caulobacteraceae bacterium]
MAIDPIELARQLIQRPSVTPADEGVMEIVEHSLTGLGFACRRMKFGQTENLYARRGTGSPNLCFAGHTDVVPPGDTAAWSHDPFSAEIRGGLLFGRGAADMKGAIAAWIAAVSTYVEQEGERGSLSFLITGDEEGPALDGTTRVVQALLAEGEIVSHCIVGEPTSRAHVGDMVKIGRRGSFHADLTVHGVQGHIAYPERFKNPIPVLMDLLARLKAHVLDDGYEAFQPSNLEVTTFDVGNPAHNVIPARAHAHLNVRFNPAHTGASLTEWIEREVAAREAASGLKIDAEISVPGEAFLTPHGPFVDLVELVARETVGLTPELSTTGGASDARFIRALCPVLEMGLVGQTMHMIDEHVPVADIETLTRLYGRLIERYFETFAA